MKPLIEDLQTPKNSLEEFANLTKRVLMHIENVITHHKQVRDNYYIYSSSSAGTTKYTRPVNRSLFYWKAIIF